MSGLYDIITLYMYSCVVFSNDVENYKEKLQSDHVSVRKVQVFFSKCSLMFWSSSFFT